jgi:hypothetical protein
MRRPGKTVKVTGSQPLDSSLALTQYSRQAQRPTKQTYAQASSEPPNTSTPMPEVEARIEDVFIPFYDRPGYTTDNAAQASRNGKMYRIPKGDGRMEERDLGA